MALGRVDEDKVDIYKKSPGPTNQKREEWHYILHRNPNLRPMAA